MRVEVLLVLALNRNIKDVLQLEAVLETNQEIKNALGLDLLLGYVPIELEVQDCWKRLSEMKPRENRGTFTLAFRAIALDVGVVDTVLVELPENGGHFAF